MNKKKEFLYQEFWLLSIMGAFQHAKVYGENIKDKERDAFKNALKEFINTKILHQYKIKVTPNKHLDNIKSVSKFSKKIDINAFLNFGVSQKLLNLYLKYLWCYDEVATPPHFPVDRTIQTALGIKEKDVSSWTQMQGEQGEKDYYKIIQEANYQLDDIENNDCKTIAELELKLFGRIKKNVKKRKK